jgi:hypothetical protein
MKRTREVEEPVQREFEPEDLPLVRALFVDLDKGRLHTLGCLAALIRAWNDRVNLISRKDAEHIEVNLM